jgi:DNA repair protein RecN
MLESLHISNYALIDSVNIEFHPGLNIITGETGAGKSIILGALSLILGGRADTRAIRETERKSIIECIFSVEGYTKLKDFCIESDIEWDDHKCIMRREISPNGRSRAFINDSPVSLAQMQAVAIQLIDIHSQHQNQLLAQTDFQRHIIDTLGGNEALLEKYTERYKKLKAAVLSLKQAKIRIAKNKENEEFIQFQLEKLKDLSPIAGEQEELEQLKDTLINQSALKENLNIALDALGHEDNGILSLLDSLSSSIEDMGELVPQEENLNDRIESIRIELNDILSTLHNIDDKLTANPAELEEINNRLEAIYDLERKHDVETVEQLIDIRDRLQRQLDELTDSDSTLSDLDKAARKAMALAKDTGKEISGNRKITAAKFADDLCKKAIPLGMQNLIVDIKVAPGELAPHGMDDVEFLFAFNKNQTPTNVKGVASGGEISRLMLSIKCIIAGKMQLPSIIFDEVDTGVSGDVANRMGDMMLDISKNLQVIVITHLPQVAAKGRWHYKVFKEDDEHSTHTRIQQLTEDERIQELALMLSGDKNNVKAQATAKELLSINH